MFCRLFELKMGTGIDVLYDHENCVDECESCKDGVCAISDEYNKPLSKDKFGWRISTRIKLPEATHASTGGVFTDFIQLIHPINPDVWITKGLKQDGETVMYFIFNEGKQREGFLSLDELNELANTKYYDGRKLKDSDFKR